MRVVIATFSIVLSSLCFGDELDKRNNQTAKLSSEWIVESFTKGTIYTTSTPIDVAFSISNTKKDKKLPATEFILSASLVDSEGKNQFATKLVLPLSMAEKDGFYTYSGKISNLFPNPQKPGLLSLVNAPGKYSLRMKIEINSELQCELNSAKVEVRRE